MSIDVKITDDGIYTDGEFYTVDIGKRKEGYLTKKTMNLKFVDGKLFQEIHKVYGDMYEVEWQEIEGQ